MAIETGYAENFKTLIKAFKSNDVCLMEVRERATGKKRIALCAVSFNGEEYGFTPFALMFDENPYDLLDPPNSDGGFYNVQDEAMNN